MSYKYYDNSEDGWLAKQARRILFVQLILLSFVGGFGFGAWLTHLK